MHLCLFCACFDVVSISFSWHAHAAVIKRTSKIWTIKEGFAACVYGLHLCLFMYVLLRVAFVFRGTHMLQLLRLLVHLSVFAKYCLFELQCNVFLLVHLSVFAKYCLLELQCNVFAYFFVRHAQPYHCTCVHVD